jgi:PTH1 family peptidyl-tRNA hydrolase
VRIVLGIGNPGKRYENTRHNIGFLILNTFAAQNNLTFSPSRFDYYHSENLSDENPFVLIKPSAYVNNSGIAVVQVLDYYNTSLKDLLVIVDDINLDIGNLRVRAAGGDGGHNGMRSIIYHTGSNNFPRIRVGIGSEFTRGMMAGYVLSKFHKNELGIIKNPVDLTLELIKEFISGGIKQMLDFYSKNKGK